MTPNQDSFALRLLKNEPPLRYHIIGAAIGACLNWKAALIGGVVIPQGYALLTTGYGYLSDYLKSKHTEVVDNVDSYETRKLFFLQLGHSIETNKK